MKFKNILIIAVIVIVCIAGYNLIMEEGGDAGLKDDIINTLPEEITSCYFFKNGDDILNTMEVTDLIIDRQITNDNLKTIDCTIETEGQDLYRTMYVTLDCIKYDDGSWQVQSFTEISDPKIAPKTMPQESTANSCIKEETGFQNIVKVNEIFDETFNQMIYYYTVHDTYDYITFAGEGVSCTLELKRSTMNYADDIERYYWASTVENNTEIVWDVLGTWHLEGSLSGASPYIIADITVNTIDTKECGTSLYSYPCWDWSINGYSGEYDTTKKAAYCYFEGSNPLDAKCILTGYESKVIITCEGVEGIVSSDSYLTTVTRQ